MQRFTMSTIRTLIFFSGSNNCSLDWFNNHRCHLSWCISHRGDERIHCDRSDSWSANLNYFFYHIFIGFTSSVLFIIASFGCGLVAGPAELLNWISDEFLQGLKCCSIQIVFHSCVSFRQFIALHFLEFYKIWFIQSKIIVLFLSVPVSVSIAKILFWSSGSKP